MHFHTPLRYPGGKGKIANFVKLLLQRNRLFDGHYIEPYAGGAGIAFALLFDEYVSHIHINDLDNSVYAFWHTTLNKTDYLCQKILETPVTMDEWYRQKDIQSQPSSVSLLELGFSTFFLNRTNRSGIMNGGVIGGKKQEGKWKIDARYNKEDLIRRIQRIGRYRSRITVYKKDAALFIQKILPMLPTESLVYFDPPYYVKGQDLYANFYEHEDHKKIASLIKNIKQYWLVSYDNTPEILDFYRNYRHISYSLSYSAADKYKGSELMFFSEKLSLPSVRNPAKVKSYDVNKRQVSLEF